MYQEILYIDEQLNTKKRNTHSLTQSLQGKPFSSARFTFFVPSPLSSQLAHGGKTGFQLLIPVAPRVHT